LLKKVGITAASNFRLAPITAGQVDISFASPHSAFEERAMLIDSKRARSPANEKAFMARNLAPAELRAVRRGVGAALRTLYSDVLHEEIPNRVAELLRQLDQQLRQLDQRAATAASVRK
jgi:Anti-sigma factor NepR